MEWAWSVSHKSKVQQSLAKNGNAKDAEKIEAFFGTAFKCKRLETKLAQIIEVLKKLGKLFFFFSEGRCAWLLFFTNKCTTNAN